MTSIINKLQKSAFSALMKVGFKYAVVNVNVACSGFSYQPKPPKALEQFKSLKNE